MGRIGKLTYTTAKAKKATFTKTNFIRLDIFFADSD